MFTIEQLNSKKESENCWLVGTRIFFLLLSLYLSVHLSLSVPLSALFCSSSIRLLRSYIFSNLKKNNNKKEEQKDIIEDTTEKQKQTFYESFWLTYKQISSLSNLWEWIFSSAWSLTLSACLSNSPISWCLTFSGWVGWRADVSAARSITTKTTSSGTGCENTLAIVKIEVMPKNCKKILTFHEIPDQRPLQFCETNSIFHFLSYGIYEITKNSNFRENKYVKIHTENTYKSKRKVKRCRIFSGFFSGKLFLAS